MKSSLLILPLYLFFLLLWHFYFYSTKNEIAILVFLLVVLFLGFLKKENYILFLFFYTLPDQRLFSLNDGVFSFINFLPLISIMIGIVFNYIISIKILLPLIFLFAYSIFLSVFNMDVGYVFQMLKFIFTLVGIYFLLFQNGININQFYIAIYAYLLGVVVSSLLGAYTMFNELDTISRLSTSGNSDANVTALNISFAVLYSFLMLNNKIGYRFWNLVFFIMLLFIGFLTMSRSFLVVVAIIIFRVISRNQKLIIPLFFISIFFVVLVLQIPFFEDLYKLYSLRFLDPSGGDITNNRYDLWGSYANYLLSSPNLLFFGISSDELYLLKLVNVKEVAHNYILEVVLVFGIIGFLIVSIVYISFLKYYLVTNGSLIRYCLSLPFITLNVIFFTGHSLLSLAFVSHFMLILTFIIFYNNANSLVDHSIGSRS